MAVLRFGTGGVPLTTKKRSTVDGIKRMAELGLQHMEMEFVHGVRMSEELALETGGVAKENDISLTVHGPYYVNLASDDNRKFYGSIGYITKSIYIGGLAGARSVTFHPAFYQGLSSAEVYQKVKKAIEKVYAEFEKKKYDGHPVRQQKIVVAPELTGKPSQFGDIEELVKLAGEFKELQLKFCIDFAHKFARSNGEYNSYEQFLGMLDLVEKKLGREYLDELHIHLSGIMHSEKGERNHVTLLESYQAYQDQGVEVDGGEEIMAARTKEGKNGGSAFRWQEVLRALKDKKVGGWLVCESPNLELDALLMRRVYDTL